jgi:hypothetical protein
MTVLLVTLTGQSNNPHAVTSPIPSKIPLFPVSHSRHIACDTGIALTPSAHKEAHEFESRRIKVYERATMTKSCASMMAGQVSANSLEAFELTDEHRPEVLAFLSERPLHTVIMSGFIRDHGLMSPLNRGSFPACRDHSGRIKGVALIGHATLVEARVDAALSALASVAQHAPRPIYVMMGEQEEIGQFWKYYAARQRTTSSW